MKFRYGFVSNSSSASFVIKKKNLTRRQYVAILTHDTYALKVLKWTPWGKNINFSEDRWSIIEDEDNISGDTIMDNFDMNKFFEAIGLKPEQYEFESDG